jgi:prepilin-type processing-associated H-X9-DG protein
MVPDYWMNGNMEKGGSGVKRDEIDLPEHTYLLGDGDGKVSAPNYTLTEKTWKPNAPKADPYAQRHLFGANYLFADGHVKWLAPDVVEAGKKDASCCTNYAFKIEIIRAGAAHEKHHAGHHQGQHNH